jgi:hypothetical protein
MKHCNKLKSLHGHMCQLKIGYNNNNNNKINNNSIKCVFINVQA